MSDAPEISLPRTVFILTMVFSAVWVAGANMVMTTEIDPKGREVSALESSIWIQQQRALEAEEQPAIQHDAVALASN